MSDSETQSFKKQQKKGLPAYMATFADLMSLLMCFFVLLLSFAEIDAIKYKMVVMSLEKAFGVQREVVDEAIPKGTSIIAQEFSPGEPKPTPLNIVRQETTDDTKDVLKITMDAEAVAEAQAKQVADIEDLIAQGVDAIIVTPLTPTSADAGIEKAVAAGIPVIVHTGLTETDAFTLEIQGGAQNFGRVMGQFLVDELNGEGNIWVLRGLPGHPEDINRYAGLLEAIEGTNIKIIAEDVGSWQYDNGKKVCETFYLSNPNVDGIWSSGADMTRACVDVFKEFGAEIPPTTGEGNNGFFGQWVEDGFASISAEYGPEQGAAGVRAAIALLEGQEMYKHYAYEPEGWDLEQVTEAYRPDLSANVWFPTSLTEERLQELYGQ